MQYFRDQPFQFIGVNVDRKQDLPGLERKHGTTWRSFADGDGGPIVNSWDIVGLPTTIVIDHRGVIRARDPNTAELGSIVLSLVKEAQSATTGG